MPKWGIEVRFVQQPTPVSCVHACLSMVTGVPVRELIDRFGNHGLSNEEQATVLTEMGIVPIPVPQSGGAHPMPYGGANFITVPSLNIAGATHLCVLEYQNDRWVLFDPNYGRKGKRHYSRKALYSNRQEFSYSEVTYLHPLRLHRGTEERLDRYAKRRGVSR